MFSFVTKWFWWVALLLVVVTAYLRFVWYYILARSKNLRWAEPGLDRFVFGPVLAFARRHDDAIVFVALLTALIWLGWRAALADLILGILINLCVTPLAKGHASAILRDPQVVGNAQLQRFLEKGVFVSNEEAPDKI